MPTITVWKNDLYQLAGFDDSVGLAELEARLALAKAELGSRTGDGRDLRQRDGSWIVTGDDLALRLELADTNRPDLWCVEGVARQLRDHARGHGRAYDFFTTSPTDQTITVDPQLQAIRPFIGGFLAAGNSLDEAALLAFIEAQETLTRNYGRRRQTVSIGLYDGARLHFPLRYRAVDRDASALVPLPPAVEADTPWPAGQSLTPQAILKQHPTGREYSWILDGYTRVPLLTDADGRVLSFPPIINSAHLGRVTPGMTVLFVEATGTELDQVLLALNILAANMVDRGWTITPVTTHYPYQTPRGTAVVAPHDLALRQQVLLTDVNRLVGEALAIETVVALLQAYGIMAEAVGDRVMATAPSYRQDYLHPVDVVEDVAISRGYDSLTPILPQEFTVGRLDPLTEFEDLLRDLLIGFGFEEVVCNILTSEARLRQRMAVGETVAETIRPFHGGPLVRIANVMNRNYAVLRDWLLPSLLEIESRSAGAQYPHRIFEVGEVAVHDPAHNMGARTESRLGLLLAEETAHFDALQSVSYALLGSLKVPFTVTAWEHPSFIPGRVALVQSHHVPLGFLGELSPQVLTNWGARVPGVALELDVRRLQTAVVSQPAATVI